MRIKLAGRAAEIVFNPEKNGGMTTGAANDFESATNIVINLLTRYGMEEGFMVSLPMEMIMKSSLAEKYVNRIDEILSKEMEFTIKAIRANEGKVKRLADELMDKSRLGIEEMAEILDAEIEERDRKEQEI